MLRRRGSSPKRPPGSSDNYQRVAEAQAKLIASIRKGGKGVWGAVPMPPVGKDVPEGDLKAIVAWILSLSSR